MTISILICFAAFFLLIWTLRRDRLSLGLPIAYLFSLLLIHVPGAIAHAVGREFLVDSKFTELGIGFTAIGAMSFVAGVWLARFAAQKTPVQRAVSHLAPNRLQFWFFCLIAGWIFTYALSPLRSIPTLGAAVDKAGAVWMLGVMLGLRAAVRRGDAKWTAIWLGALAVYPILMLLLGGFLSYGSTAIIIVLSALAISTRSHWRVGIGAIVAAVLAFHIFLSYFQNRDAIRDAVWGGASMEARLDRSANMVSDFGLFNPANEDHLNSLDQRLNQNYFAGLAASRIEERQVDFLYGRSLWEGLIALVPRALWPDKPVVAGSPKIVSEMTGLILSDATSFGVGNVMEFYINFGIPGVVVGFALLGWLLGLLDRKAAVAEGSGDLGQVFVFFLPAVALIQPNGSIVELTGGAVVSLGAGYGWKWAWKQWMESHARPVLMPRTDARRRR